MRVVVGKVFRFDGTPAVGAEVLIRLAGADVATLPDGERELVAGILTQADGAGEWSIALPPNTKLGQEGTAYRVDYRLTGSSVGTLHFLLPDTEGPHWVGDLLTDPPGAPEPSALAAHQQADPAHDASAISFTPADGDWEVNRVDAALDSLRADPGGGGSAVDSVNGKTGVVVLDADDVGADPAGSADAVRAVLTAPVNAHVPLDLPTEAAHISITHPDVVLFDEPWNGWRYWMAHTPFPVNEDENPHVVVSQDGVRWTTPAGATNPIVDHDDAEAAGHGHWSDPDLVYDPDSDELVMFWRGNNTPSEGSPADEAIWRAATADGVTWSTPTVVLAGDGPGGGVNSELLSPAVVIDTDGTWIMWVVDNDGDAANRKIIRRTSTDKGVTWDAGTECTIPAGVNPWHLDVVRAAGEWHMLLHGVEKPSSMVGQRLFYWRSADGDTWAGSTVPALPLSGAAWDGQRHYRSTFVPVPGPDGLAWDVWVAGIHADYSAGFHVAFPWTVGLWRQVALTARVGTRLVDEDDLSFGRALVVDPEGRLAGTSVTIPLAHHGETQISSSSAFASLLGGPLVIPARTLRPLDTFRFEAWGGILNLTGEERTVSIRATIDEGAPGTTILGQLSLTVPALSARNWQADFEAIVTQIGDPSTWKCRRRLLVSNTGDNSQIAHLATQGVGASADPDTDEPIYLDFMAQLSVSAAQLILTAQAATATFRRAP